MLNVQYKCQLERRWCGPAALEMVLSYYGFHDSQSHIAAKVMKDDFSFINDLGIFAAGKGLEAFQIYGLDDEAAITKLNEFIKDEVPPIVLQQPALNINDSHFRVVLNVDPAAIVVHDPLYGAYQSYKQSSFLKIWKSGGAIKKPNTIFIIRRPAMKSGIDACPYCGFSPHNKVFTCYICSKRFKFSQGFPTECQLCHSVWKTIECARCGRSWNYYKPRNQ